MDNPFDPEDPDSTGDDGQDEPDGTPDGSNDYDGDGMINRHEFAFGTDPLEAGSSLEVPLLTTLGWSLLLALLFAAALAKLSVAARRGKDGSTSITRI